jgi:hypothetical protein
MMLQAGKYGVDPNSIGRMAEAKGHFDPIEGVSYADDNTQNLPVDDDVDVADPNAAPQDEPAVKVKAVPNAFAAPSLSTQADADAPKARAVESQPKNRFMTNDPSQNTQAPQGTR